MGIDKQNIYYTFHYGLPSSVEALYQEAGRAGRWSKIDENIDKIAKCYVLHSPETIDDDIVDRLFYKETTFDEIKLLAIMLAARKGYFYTDFSFCSGT
jgi:ATP-dependent DNA helicase RecQ